MRCRPRGGGGVKREVAQLLEDVRALARMAEEEKRHYCGLRAVRED